jgi:uncharacterized protein (TIGR03118 family)
MNRSLGVGVLALLVFVPRMASGSPIGYVQTNLASDIPLLAANTDPALKNPWGMSFSATSPFWVSDQVTDVATLYNGAGAPQALVVNVPPAGQVPNGPTGQVFAGGQGFNMSGGQAVFVFATLSGTIDAWRVGTTAEVEFTSIGAVYTGLAIGTTPAGNFLYAADSKNGKVDVLNTSFSKVILSGSFIDPAMPAGFTPYNIQNIGGQLYVEYADRGFTGGFVDIFDLNGNLQKRLISNGPLDQPWGVALAPSGFGDFANDLLVGDFGDGLINAFNPSTGAFLGSVSDSLGNPIANVGLWALDFRAPGSGFDPNTLYFTAGINNEADGLFGELRATGASVPEPTSLLLLGTGLVGAGLKRWRKRRTAA